MRNALGGNRINLVLLDPMLLAGMGCGSAALFAEGNLPIIGNYHVNSPRTARNHQPIFGIGSGTFRHTFVGARH